MLMLQPARVIIDTLINLDFPYQVEFGDSPTANVTDKNWIDS